MVRITNTLSKEYDSQVSVFGTSRFLSSKSDNYGWFVDEAFILPYYISKKLFFRYIIFPSQTIYLTKGITVDDEMHFLDGVVCLIKNDLRHVDFILQSPTNVVFKIYPNNSIFCQFGTYVVDLLQDENNIFKQIHQKHRNVIKKAQSDGVTIVNGKQYCNEVLNIINQTMLRQKMTPFNSAAVNEFECLNKNIEYYVSIYKNIVQGAALIYWDQYSAYYMYGGSIDKPHSGSLNLMHWQIIQDMKKKGIQKYDFVGARIHPLKYSKISTIQRFKARFGGCMKIGYLWKYPIKPFKYKMFNIIKTLYSIFRFKKVSKDVIDQELGIKNIYLTFDYEIFFGKNSGSLVESLIKPTDLLLDTLYKNQISATFFIDTIYIEMLLKYNFLDDYILIKKQIQRMIMEGHRVELHLHPHWYDAKLEKNKWIFNRYNHYRMHSYSQDEVEKIFHKSIKILYDIILEVDKKYKLHSYRAGGWCIQPFQDLKKYLEKNEIFFDSSVVPDAKSNNNIHYFDFKNIPKKCFYRFDNDVAKEVKNGKFIEAPVSIYNIGIFFKIINKVLLRFVDSKEFGDGSGIEIEKHTFISKIKSCNRAISLENISRFLFEYIIKNNKLKDIVVVSHPKFLSNESFKCIERISKKNVFLTFKDIKNV